MSQHSEAGGPWVSVNLNYIVRLWKEKKERREGGKEERRKESAFLERGFGDKLWARTESCNSETLLCDIGHSLLALEPRPGPWGG